MPWTPRQEKTWQAIAHGWKPKTGSLSHISQDQARKMADEGVRTTDDAATALAKRKRGKSGT